MSRFLVLPLLSVFGLSHATSLPTGPAPVNAEVSADGGSRLVQVREVRSKEAASRLLSAEDRERAPTVLADALKNGNSVERDSGKAEIAQKGTVLLGMERTKAKMPEEGNCFDSKQEALRNCRITECPDVYCESHHGCPFEHTKFFYVCNPSRFALAGGR